MIVVVAGRVQQVAKPWASGYAGRIQPVGLDLQQLRIQSQQAPRVLDTGARILQGGGTQRLPGGGKLRDALVQRR